MTDSKPPSPIGRVNAADLGARANDPTFDNGAQLNVAGKALEEAYARGVDAAERERWEAAFAWATAMRDKRERNRDEAIADGRYSDAAEFNSEREAYHQCALYIEELRRG